MWTRHEIAVDLEMTISCLLLLPIVPGKSKLLHYNISLRLILTFWIAEHTLISEV
jgi:hypothetical protein